MRALDYSFTDIFKNERFLCFSSMVAAIPEGAKYLEHVKILSSTQTEVRTLCRTGSGLLIGSRIYILVVDATKGLWYSDKFLFEFVIDHDTPVCGMIGRERGLSIYFNSSFTLEVKNLTKKELSLYIYHKRPKTYAF